MKGRGPVALRTTATGQWYVIFFGLILFFVRVAVSSRSGATTGDGRRGALRRILVLLTVFALFARRGRKGIVVVVVLYREIEGLGRKSRGGSTGSGCGRSALGTRRDRTERTRLNTSTAVRHVGLSVKMSR